MDNVSIVGLFIMLTKRDKVRICDKAMQLNVQHQKGEITLKEQNDRYWKFIKGLEESNAATKTTKVPVPEFITFIQKVKKGRDGFILYELHFLNRMVFRYSGKGDFDKCIKMRDQWFKDNKN